MRALILTDASVNTLASTVVRVAANCCWSVGIKPQFLTCTATAPTVAMLNAYSDYDLVIVPSLTGAILSTYQRFLDGTVTKPVMVLSKTYDGSGIKGRTGWADSSAGWFYTNVSRTGQSLVLVARRNTISTSLTAPEAVRAILDGGDVGTSSGGLATAAWAYTADGTNYVYYSCIDPGSNGVRSLPFHLLLQEAINDGVIDAPPHRAPHLFIVDHINDDGDPTRSGGLGGWQENPEQVASLGDLLRRNSGVCYTNIERQWQDGGKDSDLSTYGLPAGGNTTLLQYLQDYSDVLLCNPYHDHEFPHNTAQSSPLSPINDARTKEDIDGVDGVSGTVASINALGCTLDYTFGHFANDRSNENLWQLASPNSSKTASADNATVQVGYGLRLARTGSASESWPSDTRAPGSGFGYPKHWLSGHKRKHRGIVFQSGIEGDATSMQASTQRDIDQTLRRHFECLNNGLLVYFHSKAFEDVAWRTANLGGAPTTDSSGGITTTYTLDSLERMAGYCAACPDTAKFAANLNKYLDLI